LFNISKKVSFISDYGDYYDYKEEKRCKCKIGKDTSKGENGNSGK
jgi:hypothetical protein